MPQRIKLQDEKTWKLMTEKTWKLMTEDLS